MKAILIIPLLVAPLVLPVTAMSQIVITPPANPAQPLTPVPEPEPEGGALSEGLDLLGRGAKRLFDGFLSEVGPTLDDVGDSLAGLEPYMRDLGRRMGDLSRYEVPETLPNGDILIRRKPDAPAQKEPIEVPKLIPGPNGEIEL